MTASPVSDLVLAADISASGDFIAMGRMHAPCPALAAAARDQQDNPADPDLAEIQFYSLASNAAGLCILGSGDIEKVLQACFAAQLVAEWRIEIPGTGLLLALFTVARFEPVRDAARTFALGLRLAGKPEFIGLNLETAVRTGTCAGKPVAASFPRRREPMEGICDTRVFCWHGFPLSRE